PAAVPSCLAGNTTRAAVLFGVGTFAGLGAVATPRAVVLAKGALNTMLTTKASQLILLVLTVGLLAAGALSVPALGVDPAAPAKAGAGDPSAPKERAESKPAAGRGGRSCIILWMSGGPSQIDTFDLKPGTANGGPFHEIDTRVQGIRISEHLSLLA